ncbi:hypothetical protein N644_1853 [Lactiplantibacillus paraplantarum]|uniref:Uncharacterized protein n=1 Tax=Lactiplantibacillus paraplantarum TaxID=60520 RepID=A0AAD0TP15_9LACO|nr:hypothetical protein DA077_07965 [Lactiplantibacillus paraplantarum]AYJ38719.1 hypothetical protein LP667_07785 [Lactiplantibacillus paraplantarum]ERL44226.1 hypothetical protein N644_1853 [Lactiplantibacillus paraplantarum]KRL51517.1 hypothetical protein FD48_GL000205 [Lactiplantibacillus paraplantarum DSM 10667]GEO60059.1 hypothetical protein LPA07_03800 [Lactiplantibacillus paraplantarum]
MADVYVTATAVINSRLIAKKCWTQSDNNAKSNTFLNKMQPAIKQVSDRYHYQINVSIAANTPS